MIKNALLSLIGLMPLLNSFCYTPKKDKLREQTDPQYIKYCHNYFIDLPDLFCLPAFVGPEDLMKWRTEYGAVCSETKEVYKKIVFIKMECWYTEGHAYLFFHDFDDCRAFREFLRGILPDGN